MKLRASGAGWRYCQQFSISTWSRGSGICARSWSPDMKPEHIGIVACSAEGAALCYRTICVEGAQLLGPHAHPEVSTHTPSFADYVRCLTAMIGRVSPS